MVEKQWWRWNNGGALMRFVLTIETEHSQHVNAIDFFFLVAATSNKGGGAANRDKRRDKGLNTKRRERALTIETDYSQHQHVNVIFFFCSGSNL